MAYDSGITAGRLIAVGIAAPLAKEIVRQVENSDGTGFKIINANRLMALGVPPIAAKGLQSIFNWKGLMRAASLTVGNFLNGVQATAVAEVFDEPPTPVSAPVISGTAKVGSVLTVTTPSVWNSSTPYVVVEYRWLADGVFFSGTTVNNITLASGQLGKNITCEEQVQNRGTQAQSAASNSLGPVVA